MYVNKYLPKKDVFSKQTKLSAVNKGFGSDDRTTKESYKSLNFACYSLYRESSIDETLVSHV